jgi:hypothetical protein
MGARRIVLIEGENVAEANRRFARRCIGPANHDDGASYLAVRRDAPGCS